MNELIIKEDVSSKIIEVRGVDVILDRDIAKILGMETKVLNQSVKRNITMFNKNNYFQLEQDEFNTLRSQIVTSKGGIRYLPYAFTKEGVLILTSILKIKNDIIIELINAFDRQNLVIKTDDDIREMIYEIREKQVILDFDLAKLYKVETKRINEAVRNNLSKFPERFCFQITKDEYENIFSRSKISTLNVGRGHNLKYLPYAFTEQGILMLATILKSEVAVETSIRIIDAFVVMKHYLNQNGDVYKSITYLNNKMIEHDDKINQMLLYFEPNEKIYLKGNEYDAYSDIRKIFSLAKKELIIIDGYIDNSILDVIRNLEIKIILITKPNNVIDRYLNQYHNINIIYTNDFHDRYFIIDRKLIYHSGASINYVGRRIFSIDKIEDRDIVKDLLSITIELISTNYDAV